MMNVNNVMKVAGKFVIPVCAGITAVMAELNDQKQKAVIADLVKRVSELEKK